MAEKGGSTRERFKGVFPARLESVKVRRSTKQPTQSSCEGGECYYPVLGGFQNLLLDYRIFHLFNSYISVACSPLAHSCGGEEKNSIACSMRPFSCLMMHETGPLDGSIYNLQIIILRLPPDKPIVRGPKSHLSPLYNTVFCFWMPRFEGGLWPN